MHVQPIKSSMDDDDDDNDSVTECDLTTSEGDSSRCMTIMVEQDDSQEFEA